MAFERGLLKFGGLDCNHHIPQRALGYLSPIDVLKFWQQKKPELVIKRVYKQVELDTYHLVPTTVLVCLKTASQPNTLLL